MRIFVVSAILSLTIFFICLSITQTSPPNVVPKTAHDTVFSAERAYFHLLKIAKSPHSTGTKENADVGEYIKSRCQQEGLETVIQTATAVGGFRGTPSVFAGKVHNVIARLKGKNQNGRGKSLLISAHYDSHPNTLGAGDDGAGVVAMLEVMRILKNIPQLENDIIFLFTDGEEVGLLGARAFISESGLTDEIGLALNFEGRGSKGVSHMFEVNENNGWVMTNFKKYAAHPFANSLNFEVYKVLPNDTDFSVFKDAGISGLNHAFIEKLEDYHSMTDTPENLDLRSLQHHGDNMLSLAKAFGSLNLENTKSQDITYFNVLGDIMVSYPASLNLVFVLVATILYIGFIFLATTKKLIQWKELLIGFLSFLLIIIAGVLIVWAFLKFLYFIYPFSNRFYEFNSYNSPWFYLAISAVLFLVISIAIRKLVLLKLSVLTFYSGALLFTVLLMYGFYLSMQTASYLFYLPLIFSITGSIVLILIESENDLLKISLSILFSLPTIALFSPIIYTVFIAFGLGAMTPSIALLMALFFGLLDPQLRYIYENYKLLIPVISASILLIALGFGHLNSNFTKKEPLQSSLWYELNADENKAYWYSTFENLDEFNAAALQNSEVVNSKSVAKRKKAAHVIDVLPPSIELESDHYYNGKRKLVLNCFSKREANSLTVIINSRNELSDFFIDDKKVGFSYEASKKVYEFQYFGIKEDGFKLSLIASDTFEIELVAIDRSIGLPETNLSLQYPDNIIPGEGRINNTLQVRKTFYF